MSSFSFKNVVFYIQLQSHGKIMSTSGYFILASFGNTDKYIFCFFATEHSCTLNAATEIGIVYFLCIRMHISFLLQFHFCQNYRNEITPAVSK